MEQLTIEQRQACYRFVLQYLERDRAYIEDTNNFMPSLCGYLKVAQCEVTQNYPYNQAQYYFPRFTRQNAMLHANARPYGAYWWDSTDCNNRVLFINWLIDNDSN